MNRLQKAEFEILCAFIRICEKLELPYYLICGSALGVAKYRGFIPWDDDIDVALLRKDYDIFLEKAPALLPEYYFLQNYKTDRNCHHFCSKIRDSRTTYIESDQKHLNIHHGVFIDIVPLDFLPCDKNFSKKYRCFRIARLIYLKSNKKYKNLIKHILKPAVQIRKIYGNFEKYLLESVHDDTSRLCNFHNAKNNQWSMDPSVYGKGICAEFEGVTVTIPEKIDEYLTLYYGDWRADLPKEQQAGHHNYAILDLDRPYTDYIMKKSVDGKKITLKESVGQRKDWDTEKDGSDKI